MKVKIYLNEWFVNAGIIGFLRIMEHSNNTTYLEVLTAQQTLLNARLSQVANRFTEIQGVITLYQALGGGRM